MNQLISSDNFRAGRGGLDQKWFIGEPC